MKVVLFCGGFGMRLREHSESIPKPMVQVGYRPILWHVMKYYAHFGHKDFVLCLGWRADVIKEYFLNYDECASNDFVLSGGGKQVELLSSDIHDWNITLVDTGTQANIAQRLLAVREHVANEEAFLANYSDGVTDLDLPTMVEEFEREKPIASFLSVKPKYNSFHAVHVGENGRVATIQPIVDTDLWMNGGFFIFNQEIFDYIQPGEELVEEPFQRLIAAKKLHSHRHDGFWGCMDTFKEKQVLEEMFSHGPAPWEVWKHGSAQDRSRSNGSNGAGTWNNGRQKRRAR